MKLKVLNYWYVSLTIHLNISHSLPDLKVKTVPFQTIQFSISTQFKIVKQFYFKQLMFAKAHGIVLFDP